MWAFFCASALAAQVDLALDTPDVREGQTVGLSLTVHDADARGIPQVPVPDGLSASFESQSQQHVILNFKASKSTTYRYALTALKAGKYSIGPVRVPSSAGELSSDVLRVEVGARPTGDGGLDELVAELGSRSLWVGQVVMLHLRFATSRALVNGEWHPPEVEGLTAEPSVQPLAARARIEQDGKPVSVEELYYPLRLGKAGARVLPGAVLQAQFAVARRRGGSRGDLPIFQDIPGFTDVRTETFSAAPRPIEIKPLPEAGRPASFTGLVGDFRLSMTPSATTVGVGQTVTLELKVEGDGALGGVSLPPLQGEGFTVYDDKPAVEAAIVDGRYQASATFKRAIVPDRPGELLLPPFELSWFDPEAGDWRSGRTEALRLEVTGEARTTEVASFSDAAARPVDRLGEDILPIHATAPVSAPLPPHLAWLLLAPGGLWLAAQGLPRVRLPRRAKVAVEGWAPLPPEPEARLAEIDRRFRVAAAGRVGCSPEALRRDQAASLGTEAEALYKELEVLRYRHGEGDLPEARVRAFVEGR